MKPLVIYHANCADGFGAAFAAWLKLGDNAEYLPMEYNQALPEQLHSPVGLELYILDFSLRRDQMDIFFQYADRVVWLDHHKTAFEMYGLTTTRLATTPDVLGKNAVPNYIRLDNNKSGAMLAWEFFHRGTEVPKLIQHIDDRDRWQFKLEGSKELHAALASYKPWTFERWRGIFLCGLFEKETWRVPEEFYMEGAAILRAHNQNVQAALKQARPTSIRVLLSEDGFAPVLNGLAANAPFNLASDLGHELANKSGTFGLVWSMAGDGQIHCSLRSNGDYDVSAIAKCFGGGGHRNAAGFSTDIDTLMSWLR
jgi:oligoribonuclease NrnB/cAMP/cGMP phosphodiesterase (DHH superfamily)